MKNKLVIHDEINKDSVSEDEYQFKNQVFTFNQPEFSLLETILWQPIDGYFLLNYHLQRLQYSADYFGFNFDINNLKTQLDQLIASFLNQPHKVRLLLDSHGEVTYQIMPLSPVHNHKFIKLSLCKIPIDSTNIFLYHKTTNRQVYEIAKAAYPDSDDVLLCNEKEEITETCIGNIVMELDGELLTPPVKCGLLAGTFRANLLDQGKIKEEIMTLEKLKHSNHIYRINSVQKWQEAVLISH